MIKRTLLIAALFAVAIPTFAQTSFTLTKEFKLQTLDSLYKAMQERYVEPEVAKKIEEDLRKRWQQGEFDSITEGPAFASKISEVIKSKVTDAHLRFRFSPDPLPIRKDPGEPSAEEIKRFEDQIRFENANFDKIQRLDGNIGYISFRGFADPDTMKRPTQAAFSFLANTDALIIDLRANGGGDPRGVQLFCSYLFGEKPVHLNDITFRRGSKSEKFSSWTLKKVEGPRYDKKDVYVLVSKRTGSGAEECAYNLQNLHRALIVGEPTWGGANPGGVVRLNEHFSVFVPVGRAENPYTHTNWEGKGVQPDLLRDPKKSLAIVQAMAIKKILLTVTDKDRRRDLEQTLKDLEAIQ